LYFNLYSTIELGAYWLLFLFTLSIPESLRCFSSYTTIIGGNLSTFRLLHGTEYLPSIENTILFLEDDVDFTIGDFERNLQSLLHLPNIHTLQGLVLGRFQEKSLATTELIRDMIASKQELRNIPVLTNANFGHTDPKMTFPIGGEATLSVSENPSLIIEEY
jgi:muramoyltetrapeptide carboxypeptidase LdcA involved in peptidoglycan recycling